MNLKIAKSVKTWAEYSEFRQQSCDTSALTDLPRESNCGKFVARFSKKIVRNVGNKTQVEPNTRNCSLKKEIETLN